MAVVQPQLATRQIVDIERSKISEEGPFKGAAPQTGVSEKSQHRAAPEDEPESAGSAKSDPGWFTSKDSRNMTVDSFETQSVKSENEIGARQKPKIGRKSAGRTNRRADNAHAHAHASAPRSASATDETSTRLARPQADQGKLNRSLLVDVQKLSDSENKQSVVAPMRTIAIATAAQTRSVSEMTRHGLCPVFRPSKKLPMEL